MNDGKELKDKGGGSVNLGRHKSQCTICLHPKCEEIEEMWMDWCHVSHIESVYQVSRDAVYRHANALGLHDKRKKNIVRVQERIIEKGDATSPSASEVVSAVNAYVKLTDAGQGTEQTQGPNPKELFERMSKEERETFARDGSLPDWFSRAKDATPDESEEGEEESQVPESKRLQ
jgi:hypothetical protein